ncbi:MAG: DUF5667 domain-containing protein [Anaerolineae bacterium]
MSDAGSFPTFDDILARCLEDVQRRHRTLDECLKAYPDQAEELKPLLLAGLMAARLNAPQMPESSVDALETRLKMQVARTAAARLQRQTPTGFAFRRLAAVIAIVMLLVFGSGAGLVAASSNSVPGDPLYGIKRLWEAIVLALSPLTGPQDVLWLQIGRTRLDEIERLAAEGRLNSEALTDLYRAMYHLTGLATSENAPSVMAFMTETSWRLLAITPPLQAKAVYDDVLGITQLNLESGTVQQPPAELPASELALTPTALLTPTITLTPSITFTPSVTAPYTATATATTTPSYTPSATATITPSRTPRIPITATKTDTPTPSATFTVTPSITPTATWTDLPLPAGIAGPTTTATPLPSSNTGGATDVPAQIATERVRATQQSVYETQTAGPPSTTPDGP